MRYFVYSLNAGKQSKAVFKSCINILRNFDSETFWENIPIFERAFTFILYMYVFRFCIFVK